MRKAEQWAYKSICGSKFYKMLLRLVFSADIPCTVKIGKNLRLPHNGLGVIIHQRAVIGDNCVIYQNVTLGGNGVILKDGSVRQGGPVLEDGVAVFSGACVLGPITIGRGSYIGANAVVTKDVPPNSIVVGNPGVIKPRTHDYCFE